VNNRFSTQAVHAGEDRPKAYGALTTPIVQTSTFTFEDTAEILSFVERRTARKNGADIDIRGEYARYGNPTQTVAERKLAALEGGEHALLFATGMSAITTTMLALLSGGDHLVMAFDCYRRTREFAVRFLRQWHIEVTLVSLDQDGALEEAIRPNTRLIFFESPTNPYLRVVDLSRVVAVARTHGITTMIDSTFATPINLRPLEHGVDLVMHSASKYLAGHNDLLAGAIIGPRAILDEVEVTRGVLGGVGSPHDAYLLLRGIKTLDLRVRRQNESTLRVAQFLENHPAVARVYYPGLPSHPDYQVARRQMAGYGGVVSFEIDGGKERTSRFVDGLQLPYIGPTLGGVESIAQQQALFVSLDPEERRATGLKDNLVRYAVGIEDVDDVIADLKQALAGI
jgi:cystathionine gamma-synthase